MAVYEALWDCTYCGHKANPGPMLKCTKCSAARPADVIFYLPEDAIEVQDEKALEEAESGADWICSNCKSHNKMTSDKCHSCGSFYRPEDRDKIIDEREYDENNVPRDGKIVRDRGVVVEPKKKRSPGKAIGIFGLLAAGVAAVLGMFKSTIEVEVVGFEWEREVKIEQRVLVEQEDWSLPPGTQAIKTYRAVHHTDKISKGFETKTKTEKVAVGEEQYVCGKRDLGNGYFEDKFCTRTVYEDQEKTYKEEIFEERPVYQTKYVFMAYTWKPDEALKTSGLDQNPKWGTKPGLDDPQRFRIVEQTGRYYAFVAEPKGGEQHREEFGLEAWMKLQKGEKLKAKKSTVYGKYKGLVK
jgi:hypothetical protein